MGEYRSTTGTPTPLSARERRWRRLRLTAVTVLTIGIIVGAGLLIQIPREIPATGYVTTEDYAEVRPPTAGTVAEILVASGDRVKKGDLLVRLNDETEKSELAEAKVQVHKIEAEIVRREAEISEQKRLIEESIANARLRLQYASSKLVRTKELVAKGLTSGSAQEEDQLKEDLARAELNSLLSRNHELLNKEIAVLRRDLEARKESVSRCETAVRAKEVRAPIGGQVVRYEFVIGELLRPESVIMEIFGGDNLLLKLRVAERYATRVANGSRYRARLTSYRGLNSLWFEGEVLRLRNVIQSEGQNSYRMATCSFDRRGVDVPPGTTAEAKIDWGRANFWCFLFGLD